MKNKETSISNNSSSKREKNKSRRTLLKGAIAGGAIAGGSALPNDWRKPVINSVILPAHAETSNAGPEGVYTANDVGPVAMIDRNQSIQYALLDALISPANASHVISGICGDAEEENDPQGLMKIQFRIAGTTVEIVITLDGIPINNDAIETIECAAPSNATLLATNAITDVSDIPLTNGAQLSLTNMVASAGQVTGDWFADRLDGGENCSRGFVANLGGTFPNASVCPADD